jgi:hypothetical protein
MAEATPQGIEMAHAEPPGVPTAQMAPPVAKAASPMVVNMVQAAPQQQLM